MTQYISDFKDHVGYAFEKTVEVGKAIGERIITLDRSQERYGKTNENQLKGRDRLITHEIARGALGFLLIAFFSYQCMMQPGVISYFMNGLVSCGTLVALKEVVIQSIARQEEKEKFAITEETEETRYSLQDLMDEVNQSINQTWQMFDQLINRNKSNEEE